MHDQNGQKGRQAYEEYNRNTANYSIGHGRQF